MDDSLLSNPGMTLAGGLRQAMYGPDAPIEKRPASELPIRGPWTDQDQMKADIGHIARNTPGMGTYDNPTLLGTVQTGLSEIFVPLGGKLFSDYEANKPRVPRGERQSEYNAMPSAQPKPQTEQSSVATRKPEDLKSLQSRGLMPHDMSVARFVTMSDADYNGTIKENTVAKNDRYSAGGTEQYRTEGERDKKRGFTYYNNDGTPLSGAAGGEQRRIDATGPFDSDADRPRTVRRRCYVPCGDGGRTAGGGVGHVRSKWVRWPVSSRRAIR